MNRVTLAIGVCCFIGSALSFWIFLLLPNELTPDFEVLPSAEVNIGPVKQGTITKLSFDLTNISSSPLEIVDVATTCGCTTAKLSKKRIAPDESVTVDLSYNSGQSRGVVHAHAKLLYFESNVEERRYKTLTLGARGEIDPDFDIIPQRFHFKKDLQVSSQQLWVKPRHAVDFIVDRVECDKRFFTATIVGQSLDKVEINVTFAPHEYYQDAGSARLAIHTNSSLQPLAYVPIEVLE